MIDQKNNAPRRYFVDARGDRVLIGLSLAETTEFEKLDLAQTEVGSVPAGPCASGERISSRETRWLELYARHDEAWRAWIAESRAEQAADLGFVNYS